MKLSGNPEVKLFILIYVVFTLLAVCGSLFFSPSFAVYVALICLAAGILFYLFTSIRYRKISLLTERLNEIVHGDYSTALVPDKEGELAILSSEIYKMTVRLREQSEMLKKDKIYLKNSIADISHQLRTPLTSVCLILPRLQREDVGREEKIKAMQEINGLLVRIDWLIASLLKISQLESETVLFKRVTINVSRLIKKALEPIEIPMELKSQTLHINVAEETSFEGDMKWSAEAVTNILKNCMEYTPSGGNIFIQAEENPVYTEIVIRDTGKGFASDELPYIFKRFYQGNKSDKNNFGIGLALSKIIIKKQNGSVSVQNHKEGGAQFHIRFYKGAI